MPKKHRPPGKPLIALLVAACAGSTTPGAPGARPSTEDPPAELRHAGADSDGESCGAELSLQQYKPQCWDGSYAMLCLKMDPAQRRCACQRGGRYFWTPGYYCNGRLTCVSQSCR